MLTVSFLLLWYLGCCSLKCCIEIQKLLLRSSRNLIKSCILSFVGYLHLVKYFFLGARMTFTSLILIIVYIVGFYFLFMISLKPETKYTKLASCKKKVFPAKESFSLWYTCPHSRIVYKNVTDSPRILPRAVRYRIDCNWTRTQNHLVLKRTLNHLAKLAKFGQMVECSFKS